MIRTMEVGVYHKSEMMADSEKIKLKNVSMLFHSPGIPNTYLRGR